MTNETEFECGVIGKVERDDDCINPVTEYDSLGTMVTWHSGYTLGHEQPECEPSEYKLPEDCIKLPLFLYDHSGITISTTPFFCPWDSGRIGFIYAKKGADGMSEEDILKCLKGEVETYNDYLTGNCWGYMIEDSEGEDIDSCWGFLGDEEYCEAEMKSVAESIVSEIKVQLAMDQLEEVGA